MSDRRSYVTPLSSNKGRRHDAGRQGVVGASKRLEVARARHRGREEGAQAGVSFGGCRRVARTHRVAAAGGRALAEAESHQTA